ncbi:hypothetical protein [Micromonospora auratinigra]|uniref:Phospholipase A2 n=1 Tax=Micromonospora auratinigra TaxID=261654 RepID=A0A1A8Z8J0_9ACTN|nr:hypothetical protein [Micromonospora auratinigra]SBT40270.1 hypothetical protein GA0070611_1195 [Micromonospora auratinigra]
MRRTLRTVLTTLSLLAAALAAPAAAHASPPPPQELGGLDLGAYCRSLGAADAVLTGGTAYDWHCRAGDGRQSALAFDAACRWTYRTDAAVDRIGNFYDPTSVRCWRVRADVITPDFTRWCQATGRSDAVLLGGTVYDWRCVSYSRAGVTYADVDVLAACRETTFGYATVERFVSFGDARSWQCRV